MNNKYRVLLYYKCLESWQQKEILLLDNNLIPHYSNNTYIIYYWMYNTNIMNHNYIITLHYNQH